MLLCHVDLVELLPFYQNKVAFFHTKLLGTLGFDRITIKRVQGGVRLEVMNKRTETNPAVCKIYLYFKDIFFTL